MPFWSTANDVMLRSSANTDLFSGHIGAISIPAIRITSYNVRAGKRA